MTSFETVDDSPSGQDSPPGSDSAVSMIACESGFIARTGATASVQLPAHQVLSELTAYGMNDVVVAVVASPQSTVIAGAAQTVRDPAAAWEQRDVMAREVPTDVACHLPQVDPILDPLRDVLAELNPMTPEVPSARRPCLTREQPVCDAG